MLIILSWMDNVWLALQMTNSELKLLLKPSPYRADGRADVLQKRGSHLEELLNPPRGTHTFNIGAVLRNICCTSHLWETGAHAYTMSTRLQVTMLHCWCWPNIFTIPKVLNVGTWTCLCSWMRPRPCSVQTPSQRESLGLLYYYPSTSLGEIYSDLSPCFCAVYYRCWY